MDITTSMLHLAPAGTETGRPPAKAAEAARRVAAAAVAATADVAETADDTEQVTAPVAKAMPVSTHVELDIDRAADRVVGRFVDIDTGEVVRQVPTEEMLRLLARTRELIGNLFDETA